MALEYEWQSGSKRIRLFFWFVYGLIWNTSCPGLRQSPLRIVIPAKARIQKTLIFPTLDSR